MSNLPLGASIKHPDLPGRWQTWSQTDETQGGYFLVPSDQEARDAGIKFAVVRVVYPHGADKPTVILIRTEKRSADA